MGGRKGQGREDDEGRLKGKGRMSKLSWEERNRRTITKGEGTKSQAVFLDKVDSKMGTHLPVSAP